MPVSAISLPLCMYVCMCVCVYVLVAPPPTHTHTHMHTHHAADMDAGNASRSEEIAMAERRHRDAVVSLKTMHLDELVAVKQRAKVPLTLPRRIIYAQRVCACCVMCAELSCDVMWCVCFLVIIGLLSLAVLCLIDAAVMCCHHYFRMDWHWNNSALRSPTPLVR